MLTSGSKLRRPVVGHQVPDTRNTFAVVRTIGDNIVVALEILNHAINERVHSILVAARAPVLVVDASEFADPDGLAELTDVILDYLDAFSDSGFVHVDAGDIPSDALSREVGEPSLIELCAHGWRAKCNAAVAERLDVLIPLLNTDSNIGDVAGGRTVAVRLVEAEEDIGMCLSACHVLGEVSKTPLVNWAIRVVCQTLVALAPEHGCTDHSVGRSIKVRSDGFVVAVPRDIGHPLLFEYISSLDAREARKSGLESKTHARSTRSCCLGRGSLCGALDRG